MTESPTGHHSAPSADNPLWRFTGSEVVKVPPPLGGHTPAFVIVRAGPLSSRLTEEGIDCWSSNPRRSPSTLKVLDTTVGNFLAEQRRKCVLSELFGNEVDEIFTS